jgi:hypothetical protein
MKHYIIFAIVISILIVIVVNLFFGKLSDRREIDNGSEEFTTIDFNDNDNDDYDYDEIFSTAPTIDNSTNYPTKKE